MEAETWAIAVSLFVLAGLLVGLFVRDLRSFLRTRAWVRLAWGGGLALAAAAMAVEGVVYVGIVNSLLLQAYVFFSAAIVGVLSLGAVRVFSQRRLRLGYAAYELATTVVVLVASFATPMSSSVVSAGIITNQISPLLIVLSSFVTVPATAILLAASAVSLRRRPSWQTLLLISGALILGAGGALDVASFPIALYYAEFLGIVLLFFGIISLPQPTSAPTVARAPQGSA